MSERSAAARAVEALLGPDLKLVQSMALLKPPNTGEKRWHQE